MDLLTQMILGALMEKAQLDSTTAANFHRQDLSSTIYLEGMPEAKFFLRLPTTPAKDKLHYWSKTSISAPDGTSGYVTEGARPSDKHTTPDRLHNNLFRRGLACKITATEMALYAASGGWQLSEAGRLQAFNDQMAYQMYMNTKYLLSLLNYVFINGVGTTTIDGGSADVQCDGLIQALYYYDSVPTAQGNIVDASGASLTEAMMISLGKLIADRRTGLKPQVQYVTSAQKKIINTWGGTIFFTRNENVPAGRDVSSYNNGYFTCNIDIEYDLPTTEDAAVSCMVDHTDMKRAELIPITAEPLAKIDNTVERMITCEMTFEYGTPVSSGQIVGLNE